MVLMHKLTYQEVIAINKRLGEEGVIQNSNLEFIMDTAKDIEDQFGYATVLLYEIPRAHSFLNGNKRTGFFSFIAFIKMNDYKLRKEPASRDKIVRTMNEIALGRAKKSRVERLVKELMVVEEMA
ncbi:MAG TPA: type II toxin-antitoxin system death-on-curing family toxin [Candidatus Acidoferrales bacterium]|nr:type II toxin-antitoxin system death-on-curing family toxin [Candidatus Acidoferrales bacterium]